MEQMKIQVQISWVGQSTTYILQWEPGISLPQVGEMKKGELYVIDEVLGVQNGEVILGKGGVPKMAKHDRFVSVAKWSERVQKAQNS